MTKKAVVNDFSVLLLIAEPEQTYQQADIIVQY